MKMFKLFTVAAIVAMCSVPVQAHSGHDHEHEEATAQISVAAAQLREFLPGGTSSVGYLTINNTSKFDATLVKATIDGLGRVEIHQHQHANGMMQMKQLDSVLVKAHHQVVFQPGGLHLMVFEPIEPLLSGQERKLTLYFNDGNRIFTNMKVISLAEQVTAAETSQHHSHH